MMEGVPAESGQMESKPRENVGTRDEFGIVKFIADRAMTSGYDVNVGMSETQVDFDGSPLPSRMVRFALTGDPADAEYVEGLWLRTEKFVTNELDAEQTRRRGVVMAKDAAAKGGAVARQGLSAIGRKLQELGRGDK